MKQMDDQRPRSFIITIIFSGQEHITQYILYKVVSSDSVKI